MATTSKRVFKSSSNLAYRLKKLVDFDFHKETIDIVNKNSYFLVGLLRTQLASGVDGNNEPARALHGPFYSDLTVFNKQRHGVGLGKQTEWVTNYMTGKFYASLKIVSNNKTFKISSDVEYFQDIIFRSGEAIVELNKENIQAFTREILLPQLRQRLSKKLNS